MKLTFIKPLIRDPNGLIIYNESGKQIDTSIHESTEQLLSKTYISPYATVLELGARYGSVSCTINKKLYDKTRQVSVEPDARVWEALDKNIKLNGCNIKVHRGFVSKQPHYLVGDNYDKLNAYGTMSVPSKFGIAPSISVEDLQGQTGLVFDTLVADCEGFLEIFFEEHPFMYQQIHTIIFEADQAHRCDYEKIRNALKEHGFCEVVTGFQNVYMK